MNIATYQTLHMNYCLTLKISFGKRCCNHLLLKTKPPWTTKVMQHTHSHRVSMSSGARIQTRSANPGASVLTHLPYCFASHNETHSKNVLPSWTFPNSYLVCQFKTSLLLRQSQDQLLPVPWLHFNLPVLLPWAISIFQTVNNLSVFGLYTIPLWEFSLNPQPSLTSLCTNWSFPSQTGLYICQGHEASTYAESICLAIICS